MGQNIGFFGVTNENKGIKMIRCTRIALPVQALG
jgi:hypothetical protein